MPISARTRTVNSERIYRHQVGNIEDHERADIEVIDAVEQLKGHK
jgi:hypothetical protein